MCVWQASEWRGERKGVSVSWVGRLAIRACQSVCVDTTLKLCCTGQAPGNFFTIDLTLLQLDMRGGCTHVRPPCHFCEVEA